MERLLTPFGETINKDKPLDDYPRPQFVRSAWQNLNGRWRYGIRKTGEEKGYDGEIIVPFSPEAILSGVERQVKPDETLYYQRTFFYQKSDKRLLLHFGAVDYICKVFINGQKAGEHIGGYFPFCLDITDFIKDGENLLEAEVTDPTDAGTQARGKQSSKRGGIWYTPQSGIWQTVWTEEVPSLYVTSYKVLPDIDKGTVAFDFFFSQDILPTTVRIFDGKKKIAEGKTETGKITIDIADAKLWSPEEPFLYTFTCQSGEDEFSGYFGMRKFGIGKDEKGISRLFLNNKPYLHNGLLDQGYWSDGLYTAPSDEAMIFDIKTMKDMGFTMLRKHIKIEPLRWYYHCDRLGMLVWQDMISGGSSYSPFVIMVIPAVNLGLSRKVVKMTDGEKHYKMFARADKKGREEYYTDSKRMIDLLYNTVSLSVWVPFNEGWGQFDAKKAYDFYKKEDASRIVDHASGFYDQGIGDLNSFHIYFTPFIFPKDYRGDERPIVLSEFGGFSLKKTGHMYNKEKFFGYRKFTEDEKFILAMKKLYEKRVARAVKKGVSALVYTEVSDVEDECNGLLTYDRRVIKIPIEIMKKINGSVTL